MTYDPEDVRKGRENDWFVRHEAELIAEARRKREGAEKSSRDAEAEARRQAHWRKCPKCGNDMRVETIAEIEIEKCSVCEGIFFDRGELETLLLKQDTHRRGFFRRVLGFPHE